MLCPECRKQGLRSEVYPSGPGTTTLMWCSPFYDEEGRMHDHDLNTTYQGFTCSNAHSWDEAIGHKCWCGWPDDGPYVDDTND